MLEDKLDLTFYAGQDLYSDGDVEEELLQVVQKPDTIEETLLTGNSWPHLYHLSNIRENILDWYNFNPEGTLLEIGSGCGAVTGLFCKKVRHVTAIELSKRRSMVNVTRNAQYDNLTIMLGNFEDIQIKEKFDYVTLIGVFEYSICYINSENPFMDMLKRAKSFLKPGGKLIIAIENKYGLKYFAGATEDHSGRNFDGLENYVAVDRVRTFSKGTLEKMLQEAGFWKNQWYYPMPDYKLPREIYSDSRLPVHGSIRGTCTAYDRDRYELMDENLCYDSVCEDGLFPQFANSFLIISEEGEHTTEEQETVSYAKYSRERVPEFRISTRILTGADGKKWVEKAALGKEAEAYAASLAGNRNLTANMNRKIVPVEVLKQEPGRTCFAFAEGETLAEQIQKFLGRPEQLGKAVKEALDTIFDFIPEAYGTFVETAEFDHVFGTLSESAKEQLLGSRAVEVSNIETSFENFVADGNGKYVCLNYDWVFDFPIPEAYLKYRALSQFYYKNREYIVRHETTPFLQQFGLTPEQICVFEAMDAKFAQYVHGENNKYCYTKNYEKNVIRIGKKFQNGEPWFLSAMRDIDRMDEEMGTDHRELVDCHVKMHKKSVFWTKVKNNLRHPKAAVKKVIHRLK